MSSRKSKWWEDLINYESLIGQEIISSQDLCEWLITELSKLRYSYIDKKEKSWNAEESQYEEDPKEIDLLQEEILYQIKQNKEQLSFEFIFEELTKLGWAPCLMYDDNGHFAISADGFQTVVDNETDDVSMSVFIEKDNWKNSIREALYYFLDK
jgi:hypothetical protein